MHFGAKGGRSKQPFVPLGSYKASTLGWWVVDDWYGGYRFGDTEIYNPWSVINYFSSGCEARSYWLSTSNTKIISDVLDQASKDVYTQLTDLLQGKTVAAYVDVCVSYPQLQNSLSSIFSFLLASGYLKVVKSEPSIIGGHLCHLAIPNKEVEHQLATMLAATAKTGKLSISR